MNTRPTDPARRGWLEGQARQRAGNRCENMRCGCKLADGRCYGEIRPDRGCSEKRCEETHDLRFYHRGEAVSPDDVRLVCGTCYVMLTLLHHECEWCSDPLFQSESDALLFLKDIPMLYGYVDEDSLADALSDNAKCWHCRDKLEND
jgi:hypothetical protein